MQISLLFEKEFDELYESYYQDDKKRKLLQIEGISKEQLDVGQMSYNYFTKKMADVSIDQNANANEDFSPSNYGGEIVKGIQKIEGYFLLWRYAQRKLGLERANKLISSIWDGDLLFHDASGVGINQVYCLAISTTNIMLEGRPYGQLQSLPPKRADSFLAQVIETTLDLSQEFAGAIAPSDLIINYAWYAKNEGLDDYRILNDLQKFVHVVSNKFRLGSQSPFTNLSLFDRENLKKVFGDQVYPDGSKIDIEYVMHIQKLFGKWFSEGDPATDFPYRFPVVTVNISKDSDGNVLDEDFLDWVSKANIKNGCFNIYTNDGNKIASCCRMINNQERMQYRQDSFGNGGLNLGSTRVCTVNLPKIALRSNTDEKVFFRLLREKLEEARDLLLIHRNEIIKRRIDSGFLKFFNPLKWLDINMFFITFGNIGVYEAVKFMGYDIKTKEGEEFTKKLLTFIEDFAAEVSKEYKLSANVEEIPGESAAPKLAKKDQLLFGKDRQPFELYSNQYIPLIEDATMEERIRISGKFMDILSGGGILHINTKERIKDPETMKKIIRYAIKHNCSHIAINYGFGDCEEGHVTVCGNDKHCSICNKPIVSWLTRVIGYLTKTSSWNIVRREYEFPRRKFK